MDWKRKMPPDGLERTLMCITAAEVHLSFLRYMVDIATATEHFGMDEHRALAESGIEALAQWRAGVDDSTNWPYIQRDATRFIAKAKALGAMEPMHEGDLQILFQPPKSQP